MDALLRDDLGDLDAVMMQWNRDAGFSHASPFTTTAPAPPQPSVPTAAAPVSSGVPVAVTTGGLPPPPPQRMGRRGTLQMVPPPVDRSSTPPPTSPAITATATPRSPAAAQILLPPAQEPSRSTSAVSWLESPTSLLRTTDGGGEGATIGLSEAPPSRKGSFSSKPVTDDAAASGALAWLDDLDPVGGQRSARPSLQNVGGSVGTATTAAADASPSAGDVKGRADPEAMLKRELLELEAELSELNKQVAEAEGHLTTATIRREAELLDLDVKLIQQRRSVEEAQREAATAVTREQAHIDRRIADLEEQRAADVAAAESARSSIAQRFGRLIATTEDSIRETRNTVATLKSEKALILESPQRRVTPEGVNLTLQHSAAGIDGPEGALTRMLEAGAGIVADFVRERVNVIRQRVVEYISSATSSVSKEVWVSHRMVYSQEADTRRRQFVTFLQNSIERFTEFMSRRRSSREDQVLRFRAVTEEMTSSFRRRCAERLAARADEVRHLHEREARAAEEEAETAVRYVMEKFAVQEASDASIAQQQWDSAHRRHDVELRNHNVMFRDEEAHGQERLAKLRAVTQSMEPIVSEDREAVAQLRSLVAGFEETLAQFVRDVSESATAPSPTQQGQQQLQQQHSLALLLDEKQHVVQDLKAEVQQQWMALESSRHRCDELRQRCALALGDLADAIHEARLSQTSAQSQVNATRNAWEAEHRAQLCGTGATAGAETAAARLQGVAAQLLTLVAKVQTLSADQRRTLGVRMSVILQEDKAAMDAFRNLQTAWCDAMVQQSVLGERAEHVNLQHVQVESELAKLRLEEWLLAERREAFSTRAEALQLRSRRLKELSDGAMAQKRQVLTELAEVEQRNEAIAAEQRKLNVLQGELLLHQHSRLVEGGGGGGAPPGAKATFVVNRSADGKTFGGAPALSRPFAVAAELKTTAVRPVATTMLPARRVSPFADLIQSMQAGA